MKNQALATRLNLLSPGGDVTAANVIWISADRKRYRLHEMQTSHLVFIVRLVVNEWAERIGVEPIQREAEAGYKLRHLNFEAFPLEFFLVRARIFTVEAIRRMEAGEVLTGMAAIAWEQVKQKILECLAKENRALSAGSGGNNHA
jgi:hypothetical protein